jgi:hypothetical protein
MPMSRRHAGYSRAGLLTNALLDVRNDLGRTLKRTVLLNDLSNKAYAGGILALLLFEQSEFEWTYSTVLKH